MPAGAARPIIRRDDQRSESPPWGRQAPAPRHSTTVSRNEMPLAARRLRTASPARRAFARRRRRRRSTLPGPENHPGTWRYLVGRRGRASPGPANRDTVVSAVIDRQRKQRNRRVGREVGIRIADLVEKLFLDRLLADSASAAARFRDDATPIRGDFGNRKADAGDSGVCSQSVEMPPVSCVPHSIKCPATVAPARRSQSSQDQPNQWAHGPTVKLGSATRPVITRSAPRARAAAIGRAPR